MIFYFEPGYGNYISANDEVILNKGWINGFHPISLSGASISFSLVTWYSAQCLACHRSSSPPAVCLGWVLPSVTRRREGPRIGLVGPCGWFRMPFRVMLRMMGYKAYVQDEFEACSELINNQPAIIVHKEKSVTDVFDRNIKILDIHKLGTQST